MIVTEENDYVDVTQLPYSLKKMRDIPIKKVKVKHICSFTSRKTMMCQGQN